MFDPSLVFGGLSRRAALDSRWTALRQNRTDRWLDDQAPGRGIDGQPAHQRGTSGGGLAVIAQWPLGGTLFSLSAGSAPIASTTPPTT